MTLQPGSRIASYEITSSLGAGGMGEVYRARDTKLQRDVALKVLPAGFASDPDRVARFSREAHVLASLNHPHIAQIYGFEKADATSALIMELVEGEDLAARLARGALPLDEALAIALQMAQALEAAHERGVIHRDLKPANIKLTPDGTVKVLDFGLAKAFDESASGDAASESAPMNSPTMSIASTRAGVILGTAAYMAPEQARGQAVDRRADIWAFGVVLFEMLAGRTAFAGETISDVLASVLKNDLDWTALPATLPPPILSLLRRCLTADRRNRLRDIGEARIAIAEYLANPAGAVLPSPTAPAPAGRGLRAWQAAAVLFAVAFLAASAVLVRGRGDAARVSKFEIGVPPKTILSTVSRPALALSPDGRLVVFAAIEEGASRLYVRRFEQFEARPLPGTEGGSDPVISPDGQSIVFTTGTMLKLIRLDGAVTTLTAVNDPRGATWVDNETIVFVPEAIGGLMEISTAGGTPKTVTTIPAGSRERTHRWPHALPGGRYVLFTAGTTDSPDSYDDSPVLAVDRQSGERHPILPAGSMARYLPTGHLAYARGGMLFAVPFDPATLKTSGSPKAILQGVSGDSTTGAAHVSWAADGTLAYLAGDASGGLRRLVWVDRTGQTEPIDLPLTAAGTLYNDMRISPDRSRVALSLGSSGRADIWVYTFDRRTFTRLTFTGTNATPIWSSDSRELYFAAIKPNDTSTDVLRMDANGGAEPVKVATFEGRAYLKFMSRDGAWGVLDVPTMTSARSDIVRFTVGPAPQVTPIAGTVSFDEYGGTVSPDSRWLAYQSDESGRHEVYVRSLDGGGRWQISTGGGEEPMWAPSGKEIYFRDNTRLLAVGIETTPSFSSGRPSVLFDGIYNLRSDTGVSYDVDPKSGRFLMVRQATDDSAPAAIRIVLNWFEEVKRQFAAR